MGFKGNAPGVGGSGEGRGDVSESGGRAGSVRSHVHQAVRSKRRRRRRSGRVAGGQRCGEQLTASKAEKSWGPKPNMLAGGG